MFIEDLRDILIRDEALRLMPYLCPAGKNTIGVGRNLTDKGISREEALFMLDNDINEVLEACRTKFPWFCHLSDARRIVVASMVFNLGMAGFLKFRKAIICIELKEYEAAALEMLDSRWAEQVGNRADRLAHMMKEG